MKKINIEDFTMYIVYNFLRFIAIHSNSYISSKLWTLWMKIGGDYVDGALITGTMCKISKQEDCVYYEDVDLGL